jgi:hypothetical protein
MGSQKSLRSVLGAEIPQIVEYVSLAPETAPTSGARLEN